VTADEIYGALREDAHLSGYAAARGLDRLGWLLDGDQWRHVGPGFATIDDFLATLDLSGFDMSARRPLVAKLAALDGTQRAIARALGVGVGTVNADLAAAGLRRADVQNRTPPALPGPPDQDRAAPDVQSRTWAEAETGRIGVELARWASAITAALRAGVAPSRVAAVLTATFRQFERDEHHDPGVVAVIRDALFWPMLESVLAWPAEPATPPTGGLSTT
jgi:hypothetical protein